MARLSPELFGGLLIVMAMAILGFSDNIFYFLEPHGAWTVSCGALFCLYFTNCAFCLYHWSGLTTNKMAPCHGAHLLQTASMFLYFGSLPIMSVAEAAAGLLPHPIFVFIIYQPDLSRENRYKKNQCGSDRDHRCIFGITPDQAGFHILQTMPVAAGALYALASMTTRRWCADESPLAIVAMFLVVIGGTGALATTWLDIAPVSAAVYDAAPFFFRGWQWMDMSVWGWMFLQALLSVIAIFMLTRGYQVAETSYMAVFEYSLLIFAALWTYILFGDTLAATSIIGFVFIAAAGVIISRAFALSIN